MSSYNERICFECRSLHEGVDEVYESFFTEDGEILPEGNNARAQDKLLELRNKIDDFLSILND